MTIWCSISFLLCLCRFSLDVFVFPYMVYAIFADYCLLYLCLDFRRLKWSISPIFLVECLLYLLLYFRLSNFCDSIILLHACFSAFFLCFIWFPFSISGYSSLFCFFWISEVLITKMFELCSFCFSCYTIAKVCIFLNVLSKSLF